MHTLSKSDFKLACNCPKKLHYKKQGFPSALHDNEFMKMLAEGGYVVGKLAQLLYPGIEVQEDNTELALQRTAELLAQHTVTIHEAALRSGQKLIRVDILKKTGNHFELIEVKAKSFDAADQAAFKRNKNGDLNKKNEEYIKDAIFQTIVLQEVYPEATIDTYLLMPDKSSVLSVEAFPALFKTITHEPAKPGAFRKVEVVFNEDQDPNAAALLQQIKEDRLLGLLKVNDEVNDFKSLFINEINFFTDLLNRDFNGYAPVLDKACKQCEFHATEKDGRDGFNQCWAAMATIEPKLWDIYQAGKIGGGDGFVNGKIAEKKIAFAELEELDFQEPGKDGKIGAYNRRRNMQYENTIAQTEFPSSEMDKKVFASELKQKFKYPLHFIDFETMASAISFHKGLSPYTMFPFQWSVHSVASPGAAPVHHQYLNKEPGYPGFRFAESLMETLGNEGTPLMWSTHENTTLKNVLKHMTLFAYERPELKKWLLEMTSEKDAKGNMIREGRLVDMNAFALKHYFHPDMKGRTSIKVTLPAVWTNNRYLHDIPWFKQWVLEKNGQILDPYEQLKVASLPKLWGMDIQLRADDEELFEFLDGSYDVKDGGAAMKAYQDLIFAKEEQKKEQISKQLLSYCELDTLAMFIIYSHWERLADV
jgi:hypothetical protein